eukprot:Skav235903  [mRNA]  locus=scaffold256:148744:149022:+ [translate_table: standard]
MKLNLFGGCLAVSMLHQEALESEKRLREHSQESLRECKEAGSQALVTSGHNQRNGHDDPRLPFDQEMHWVRSQADLGVAIQQPFTNQLYHTT